MDFVMETKLRKEVKIPAIIACINKEVGDIFAEKCDYIDPFEDEDCADDLQTYNYLITLLDVSEVDEKLEEAKNYFADKCLMIMANPKIHFKTAKIYEMAEAIYLSMYKKRLQELEEMTKIIEG